MNDPTVPHMAILPPASAAPPVPSSSATVPPDDRLRRLQFGVAGLVGVLLLVGLAGIISDRANPDPAAAADGTKSALRDEAPNEPLAELGVQPTTPDEAAKAAPKGDPAVVDGKGPVPDLEPDPVLQRARDAAKK